MKMSVLSIEEVKLHLAISSDDFNPWILSRIKTFEHLLSFYTGRLFFDAQAEIDKLIDEKTKEYALLWDDCPPLKDAGLMFLGYAWQNRQVSDFGNALPAIDGLDFYINPYKRLNS